MSSCKHETRVVVWPGETLICHHCGIRVGRVCKREPANDEPEAVRVEMRAAELANTDAVWTPEEIGGGYVCAVWRPGECFSDVLDNNEQQAGYLARLITEHATHDAASDGGEESR